MTKKDILATLETFKANIMDAADSSPEQYGTLDWLNKAIFFAISEIRKG